MCMTSSSAGSRSRQPSPCTFRAGLALAAAGCLACLTGEGVQASRCCADQGWPLLAYHGGVGLAAPGVLLVLRDYRAPQRYVVEMCSWVGLALASTASIVMLAGDAYPLAALDAVAAILFGIGAGCLRKSGRTSAATPTHLHTAHLTYDTAPAASPPPVNPGPHRGGVIATTLAWGCLQALWCACVVASSQGLRVNAASVWAMVGAMALAMLLGSVVVAKTYTPYVPQSRTALHSHLFRLLGIGIVGYFALVIAIVATAASTGQLAEKGRADWSTLSLVAVWDLAALALGAIYICAGTALCVMKHRYGC
eukprot:TRINITY_DN33512_c0_g1_i1.p1 TRINITY_DN33512_c0_g1~~TRINITY_DN33512_c0_g1_i1.p1  ORF type:complete len:309 (+),score=32.83 TRINITY_DN33512_c0_g1_i1:58-984(+)